MPSRREEFTTPEGNVEAIIIRPPSKILSIQEIVDADDILEATVEVPEWGGAVRIRQYTKDTEFAMRREATIDGTVDSEYLEMLMIVQGVIDPPMTKEHVGMLRGKSQVAVDRILKRLVGINAEAPGAQDAAIAQFPDTPGTDVPVPTDEGTGVPDGEGDEVLADS